MTQTKVTIHKSEMQTLLKNKVSDEIILNVDVEKNNYPDNRAYLRSNANIVRTKSNDTIEC